MSRLQPTTYALDGRTVIDAAEQITTHLTGRTARAQRQRTLSDVYADTARLNALTGTVNPAHTAARHRLLAVRY